MKWEKRMEIKLEKEELEESRESMILKMEEEKMDEMIMLEKERM